MENVLLLKIEEKAQLDSAKLAELYIQLGELGAQDVVCRAMEELAVRLADLDGAYDAMNMAMLRKGAKGIIAIAEQVGMCSLAWVAMDLCGRIDEKDTIAIAATLARLLRIGEGSLTAVWDLQDLSV